MQDMSSYLDNWINIGMMHSSHALYQNGVVDGDTRWARPRQRCQASELCAKMSFNSQQGKVGSDPTSFPLFPEQRLVRV